MRVTDPMGYQTAYQYDVMGNITSMTNAKLKTTTYEYDIEGNMTSLTSPMGRSNEIVEDFECDEIQNIHNIFPDAIFFYLMCYTNNAVLKKIIQRLTFQEKIYVDDDRGNIFTFIEFKEYCLHTL